MSTTIKEVQYLPLIMAFLRSGEKQDLISLMANIDSSAKKSLVIDIINELLDLSIKIEDVTNPAMRLGYLKEATKYLNLVAFNEDEFFKMLNDFGLTYEDENRTNNTNKDLDELIAKIKQLACLDKDEITCKFEDISRSVKTNQDRNTISDLLEDIDSDLTDLKSILASRLNLIHNLQSMVTNLVIEDINESWIPFDPSKIQEIALGSELIFKYKNSFRPKEDVTLIGIILDPPQMTTKGLHLVVRNSNKTPFFVVANDIEAYSMIDP